MPKIRTDTWVTRKLGVPKNYYTEKLYTAYLKLLTLSYQGEWPTFLLLSGTMRATTEQYSSMAAKGHSCRTLDWCRRGGEVGAFLDRVKELFDFVTSATELPSFEELFKVHALWRQPGADLLLLRQPSQD